MLLSPKAMRTLFLLFALVTGCQHPAQAPLDQHRALWKSKAIADYRYDFQWHCFCADTQKVQLTVSKAAISGLFDLEEKKSIDLANGSKWRTLDGLFDLLQDAIQRNADSMAVTYDPDDGHPITVSIDYLKNAVDEEMGFTAGKIETVWAN